MWTWFDCLAAQSYEKNRLRHHYTKVSNKYEGVDVQHIQAAFQNANILTNPRVRAVFIKEREILAMNVPM